MMTDVERPQATAPTKESKKERLAIVEAERAQATAAAPLTIIRRILPVRKCKNPLTIKAVRLSQKLVSQLRSSGNTPDNPIEISELADRLTIRTTTSVPRGSGIPTVS
jgi:hypothetical protein